MLVPQAELKINKKSFSSYLVNGGVTLSWQCCWERCSSHVVAVKWMSMKSTLFCWKSVIKLLLVKTFSTVSVTTIKLFSGQWNGIGIIIVRRMIIIIVIVLWTSGSSIVPPPTIARLLVLLLLTISYNNRTTTLVTFTAHDSSRNVLWRWGRREYHIIPRLIWTWVKWPRLWRWDPTHKKWSSQKSGDRNWGKVCVSTPSPLTLWLWLWR